MKKIVFIGILLIVANIIVGCSPAKDEQLVEELVLTQVSINLTETAIRVEAQPEPTSTATLEPSPVVPAPEEEPTTVPTATPTETPTSTPDEKDPVQLLGQPAWSNDFNGDTSPWDRLDSDQASFKTANGFLNLTAKANPNWHSWYLSGPTLKDAYLEATIQMSACSGRDRFGLIVRGSSDGQQFYYLGITCDGRWGLFRMAENVTINTISDYQEDEQLTPGLAEPHRVGIWMKDENFTVYINGVEVGSAKDATLKDAGYTGFLIAFANTPGFTVKVDQLKYWSVP
ncbi:MAG: LamG domain-containing protein [Chloroflexi bacterium]|nr:LamG domain-containing protein [Chloroflexota bacterium]